MPADLLDPFSPSPRLPNGLSPRVGDYRLIGCWQGRLEGAPFVFEEYFSTQIGAGVAVAYDGKLVGHLMAGTGPPAVVRFTGEWVCWGQQAGAYYDAVNLQTGQRVPDREAQRVCPPAPRAPGLYYPPKHVLGLGNAKYRFPAESLPTASK